MSLNAARILPHAEPKSTTQSRISSCISVGSDVHLIGRQGDNVYLVEVEPINDEAMARVLDLAQKRLFPIAPLASLLARGYWEENVGKPGELERLLALVKHAPSASSGQ